MYKNIRRFVRCSIQNGEKRFAAYSTDERVINCSIRHIDRNCQLKIIDTKLCNVFDVDLLSSFLRTDFSRFALYLLSLCVVHFERFE